MATTKAFFDYAAEQLARAGEVTFKKMMGEYLVYFRGKLMGDICDNTLYLKQTPTSTCLFPDAELGYPYEGSRTLMLMIDGFEDAERMRAAFEGMYAELPDKKKKG